VALREKDIVFEEIIDVPWNTNTLTKGINPLGKIPILLDGNHEPLFDSKVIIQYLDYYKPQPLLYPKNPKDNISARLVETVADGVCDAIVLIFLENSRKETLKSKDWIQRQEKKIFEGVKYLSNYLEGENYFVGNHFNIADICGFSCLEYIDLRFPKFKWRNEYQNLEKYWIYHKNRQSFQETKPIAQIIQPLDD
jgi:glutathione S-transferase